MLLPNATATVSPAVRQRDFPIMLKFMAHPHLMFAQSLPKKGLTGNPWAVALVRAVGR
jgi:hypothetical protein